MSDNFLRLYQLLWRGTRPLLFRPSPQQAHDQALALWRRLDDSAPGIALLRAMQRAAFASESVSATDVGGVHLPQPLILAAGMVKGEGFPDEQRALAAVEERRNILPGWRSLPALVGPVEFGSCTRWPRTGNSGTVLWRDSDSRSTRNRVGLRNPGARAVAAFLAQRREQLPAVWGLNIATSPGVDDIGQQREELLASLDFFLRAGVRPSWFTLNISCPNIGDEPARTAQRRAAPRTLRAGCPRGESDAIVDQGRAGSWRGTIRGLALSLRRSGCAGHRRYQHAGATCAG